MKKINKNGILYCIPKTKVLFIMRLTAFFFFVSTFTLIASGTFSQNKTITIERDNVLIKDVLREIEDQSGYYFIYNNEFVDVYKKIDIHAKNQKINALLDKVFQGQHVSYSINDRRIILSPAETHEVSQQSRIISGKVTDSAGAPLPGVTVVVKGTTQGTITNADGNYTITEVPANGTLVFSFVGMRMQEVPVTGKTSIDVVMAEDAIGIEEVVAIGYGTQKKATTTGAISSVDGEELAKSPTPNLTNSFAGRFAGVTTVSPSGEPGYDGASIRIRGVSTTGNASALIVVDGIAGREIDNIDPYDIESVTVLKDASAAIYGAQGANGVILVTTKRGKLGKPKLTFNLNSGGTQATVLPDMANSVQYANMVNEINESYGNPATYSPADITAFADGSDPWGHPDTNWHSAVLKPWSFLNSNNMSISGGSEKTQFNVSVGGEYQDAIYKRSSTDYSQVNFRSNIDTKISDYINVAFDVAGRKENRNNLAPVNSTNIQVFNSALGAGDIFEYILRGKPTMNAFWPNGKPGPDIENGMNPAVVATDVPGYDKDTRYDFESNMKMKIDIPWVKGLSVTGNFSFDADFESRKIWRKPWSLYDWDGVTMDASTGEPALVESVRGPATANLHQATQNTSTMTYNALINYEKQLGVHSIKLLAAYERSKYQNDRLSAYRNNYKSTILDQLFAGGNDGATNYGILIPIARVNYFGRLGYNYAEKYLFDFNWRYDGSNNFAPGHQFGFFPGFLAGWRISEEQFWKNNLPGISYFKIRGSYGITGNDRIAANQYLANYGYTPPQNGSLPAVYIFGNKEQNPMLQQIVVPNINVTWETAVQRNIGFETRLFENKFGIEFDYFKYNRSDMLLPRNGTVPGSTGITSQLPDMNMGKASNKGFELVLSYGNNDHELKYNISVNGSYSKSKVDYIDEVVGGDIEPYQIITGKPIPNDIRNPYYDLYYQAIGIYKDQAEIDATPHWSGARPGDIIFEDVNDDGVIDGKDQVRNEFSNIPRFTGGLSLDLNYKQFDFSVLFQGAAGATQYYLPYSGLLGNFPKDFADNRWTSSNPDASYPRAFNLSEYWYIQRNTFFLNRTDYIRLKNLVVGYTLPSRFNSLLGIDYLRLFVSANNLLTITNLKNFDPEMANERGRNYPLQRVINGGITLTF